MSDLILNSLRRQNQNVGDVSSGDPASSITEEEKQRILQELENARQTDSKTIEQLKVEKTAWSSEDSLAASERFFSSMALGWGDDMQLWVQSQSESLYSDESSEDIYKRLRTEYDQRQSEFKQRQPGAYMTADIAGSVASPVNFIPGVNIAARAGMVGRAAQATRAASTGGRVAAEGANANARGCRIVARVSAVVR